MSTAHKASLLPSSGVRSYIPDSVGYGAGLVTSLGAGAYQGFEIFTSSASPTVQTWVCVAVTTGLAVQSIFGFVRTYQHKNVAYVPLTEVRVAPTHEESPDLTQLHATVDQIFNQLGLNNEASRQLSIQEGVAESPQNRLVRQILAITLHYQQKIGQYESEIRQIEPLRRRVQELEAEGKRQLKFLPLTELAETTAAAKLERELKRAQEELTSTLQKVARLEETIVDLERDAEFKASQIQTLQGLLRGMTDVGRSPQVKELLDSLSQPSSRQPSPMKFSSKRGSLAPEDEK